LKTPSTLSVPGPPPAARFARVRVRALALLAACSMAATACADNLRNPVFVHRAEIAFEQARAQYRSHMDNPVVAWEFARTCYDWADWATNKNQRASIARQGIAACRQSLLLTNSAAAHYYLAMNMGQLARGETLGALKLVRTMEQEFLIVTDLDVGFDFAGADRGLGLLCRDAPGWPLSIGNRVQSRKFLQTAATLAPNYPENILNLAESDLKWGNKTLARKELAALNALWPAAQKAFSGQAWEQSWSDWSERREALRKKLSQ
jgi:hypothetical protein